MMTRNHRPALLGVIALCLFASSCASAPPIPASPMPSGVTFTGKWWSPEYENMVLEQKGQQVTGTFSYRTGGTIEGTLEGGVLKFAWVQPGEFGEARREVRGSGFLRISLDGNAFGGRWGYGQDHDGGGVWTGERILEDEPEYDVDAPVFNR